MYNGENSIRENIPSHIAIIMDGNGRWAKKRGLPRTAGHKAGTENIEPIVKKCSDMGIKYLTLYAFSTENWKRPPEEVNYLMWLFDVYMNKKINELHKNNVCIKSIGDTNMLPESTQKSVKKALELTKNNTGLVLTVALNYGFREDLANAVKLIIKANIAPESVDELTVKKYLSTASMPDPDLIIRTSGELRLSNFLMYEAAYSEFYFTDILWPDFGANELEAAINDFLKRKRRYGGL